MKIRSPAKLPQRVQITFEGPGRTRQSMREECDINNIMKKYQSSGAITHFARHEARYGFADSVTFHEALNIVTEADTMFADLPSELRKRFDTPGAFLDFVQDEKNGDEMIELGLRAPRTPIEKKLVPLAAEAPEIPAPAEPAATII